MSTVQQQTGETRAHYLSKARSYAKRKFDELSDTPEFRHAHVSHAAAKALELTEERFCDLRTFGVEGDSAENGEGHITIQYLNRGDTYETTICFYRGRFIMSSWGDIVEREGV